MSCSKMIFMLFFVVSAAISARKIAGPPPSLLDADVVVNALICENLSVETLNLPVVEAACIAAGLKVNVMTHHEPRSVAIKSDVHVDAFLKVILGCNDIIGPLSASVNSLVSVSIDLFGTQLLSTLIKLTAHLEASIDLIANILSPCTDADVAIGVYAGFGVFVAEQIKLLTPINAQSGIVVAVGTDVALHSALVNLKLSLEVFVKHLFVYISVDLDTLGLRTSLFVCIQAAIDATI